MNWSKNVTFYAALVLLISSSGCMGTTTQCSDHGGAGGGEGGEGGAGGGTGGVNAGGGTACSVNDCDPTARPEVQKAACEDDDPRTADRCIPTTCGGACAHVDVVCDPADDNHIEKQVCDDGDPCTVDRCEISECGHIPISGCNACTAKACAAEGAECGSVVTNCGSGSEFTSCGTCWKPDACGGSGVAKQCGNDCESKYTAECKAAGLSSTWGFLATCKQGSIYFWEENGGDDGVMFCDACPGLAGCKPLEVLGVGTVTCCP